MYDSRTDAPRTRHAHHYCRSTYTDPARRRLTDAAAVAEALAELEADDELALTR